MKRLMIAALAATALVLAACSGAGEAEGGQGAEKTPITLGLTFIPNVQFAPMYVAEHEGYFEEAGLDVTIRHHGSQESLLGALQSGEEDVVFAGGDEMLQGRATGIDVVNWATMYQQYPVKLIVPESSDIKIPSDLKGKKVGLPGPYGENYFALLAMFNAYGLTENDVDIQYVGYTQAAALAAGEVDAIIGYSNSDLVNIAGSLGADMRVTALGDLENATEITASWPVRTIDMVDGGLPLVAVGLGSLRPSLESNEDAYIRLLGALDKAVQFSIENPEEALDITATHVPDLVEPESREIAAVTLALTLELYTGGTAFGAQDEQRWEEMTSFMWDNDLLEEQVPVAEAFVDLTE